MNDWSKTTLGEHLSLKHGYAFKSKYFSDDGEALLLTPGHFLPNGGFQRRSEKDRFYSGQFPRQFILEPGDLIVAMTDLTQDARILGSPAFVPAGVECLHNQRIGLVQSISDHLDKNFLFYLMCSPGYRGQLKGSATGSTVKHTAPERIYKVLISLPSLPIQKRIAGILSAYDDLIAVNERRIAILEEIARRVFETAFGPGNCIEFICPDHDGWQDGVLDDVIVLQRGFDLPKAQRNPGDYPIVSATDVSGTHTEAKVSGPGLVTGRSGSIGTVQLVWQDHWPLNTTLWSKHLPAGSLFFALYTLESIDLAGFNSGAAVPTLNRNDIKNLPVRIPPRESLQKFDAVVGPMHEKAELLRKHNANLRATRDLLLPRLISGEIDVSKTPAPRDVAA